MCHLSRNDKSTRRYTPYQNRPALPGPASNKRCEKVNSPPFPPLFRGREGVKHPVRGEFVFGVPGEDRFFTSLLISRRRKTKIDYASDSAALLPAEHMFDIMGLSSICAEVGEHGKQTDKIIRAHDTIGLSKTVRYGRSLRAVSFQGQVAQLSAPNVNIRSAIKSKGAAFTDALIPSAAGKHRFRPERSCTAVIYRFKNGFGPSTYAATTNAAIRPWRSCAISR